jgi:hypothetical protein
VALGCCPVVITVDGGASVVTAVGTVATAVVAVWIALRSEQKGKELVADERRAPRPRRPPPPAAPRPTLAMGQRDYRRGHPAAGPAIRLTSRNRRYDQGRTTPGTRGTPPARRHSRDGQPRPIPENQHQPNHSGQHVKNAKDRG